MENFVGRSNFMIKYYKNYKEELDIVNEESKKFKPKNGGHMPYFIVIWYFMDIFFGCNH